jgi:hypothetical protein
MSNHPASSYLYKGIQVATLLLLGGRGWQHLFKKVPYRDLFWDEKWMRKPVEFFLGMDWSTYLHHPNTDLAIQIFSVCMTIPILIGFLVALAGKKAPAWSGWFLGASSLVFALMAILSYKESSFQVAQLMEYGLQIGTPLIFWGLLARIPFARLLRFSLWAIGVTFIGHGLYAIGWYDRPGHFYIMVMNGFGVSTKAADHVLLMAGILDFVAVACLLLKGKIRMAGLLWCALWGVATAAARIVGNYYTGFLWDTLSAWTFEMVYRLPHGLVPLALLVYYYRGKESLAG